MQAVQDGAQAGSPSTMIRVAIPSEVEVAGGRILLADVAHIQCDDSRLKARIGAIDLGTAPMPGKDKQLSGRRIHSILTSQGRLSSEAQIVVPQWVTVVRLYQRIDENKLTQLFAAHLFQRTQGDRIEISRVKIRGLKPLPVGKLTLTVLGIGKKTIRGNVSLRVGVGVNGRDHGRLTVTGWVDRFARVVCASRFIPKDTLLTEADLNFQVVNLSKSPGNLIAGLADVLGKNVSSGIKAGKPIRQNRLTLPYLVQKGDRVRILAHSETLQAGTVGIALDRGMMGDQIKVENLSSGKKVVGRITGASTVGVIF